MAEEEEEVVTGETASDINKVDSSTVFKVVEWVLLLIVMMWSTSHIIQGIPPSNEIKFVAGTKPVGIWLFAFLCYIIMVAVKMTANRRVVLESEEDKESIEGPWQVFNIFIYFLICMLAYIFCLSYLCMKLRHKPLQSGGGPFDWMDKGTNIPLIDPSIKIIILVGVFLVIVNSFTNLFLYLKNKKESEKDSVARSIYQSQLVILLFILLTMLFLIIIGQNIPFPDPMISGVKLMDTAKGELGKWFFFLIILLVGGILVNKGADSGFFGL